jgi:L-lactate utilization protein LutB
MKENQVYNALLAQEVIKNLDARNIEGYYFETMQEAMREISEMVPTGSVISCGGSATLQEIDLRNVLKNEDYVFLDPNDVTGGAAKDDIAHRALASDYYFMSANAIARTGELVNIDGYGNRTAALIFGPKNVIVIAGMNKVEMTLESAVQRAETVAAPKTLLIFKKDYATYDDLRKAAEAGQGQLVITKRAAIKGRIKVMLVGEDLGY